MNSRLLSIGVIALLWCLAAVSPAGAAQRQNTVIVLPQNPSWAQNLAAREVRRYIYLRTGRLLPISAEPLAKQQTDTILITRKGDATLAGVGASEFASALKSSAPATGSALSIG